MNHANPLIVDAAKLNGAIEFLTELRDAEKTGRQVIVKNDWLKTSEVRARTGWSVADLLWLVNEGWLVRRKSQIGKGYEYDPAHVEAVEKMIENKKLYIPKTKAA